MHLEINGQSAYYTFSNVMQNMSQYDWGHFHVSINKLTKTPIILIICIYTEPITKSHTIGLHRNVYFCQHLYKVYISGKIAECASEDN